MEIIVNFIGYFLQIYMLCFFVWALLSWIPQFAPSAMSNPILSGIQEFLNSIIMPWVRLFSFVRPLQLGGVMLDMSSLVAFLVLIVVANYVYPALAHALLSTLALVPPATTNRPLARGATGMERSTS